jgi:hypothetical protein
MDQRPGFDWGRLTMGQKGVLISGVLLFIDLFLTWSRIGECPFCFNEAGFAGVGFIALLLTIALLIWEGLNILGTLRTVNVSTALVTAALAFGAALFAVIRILFRIGDAVLAGWLGLVLALALGYAAYVRYQESQLATPPPAAPPPV